MLLSHLELKISIWLGLADPGHLPPGIQSLDTRQNINIDSTAGEFNDYLGAQFNQNDWIFYLLSAVIFTWFCCWGFLPNSLGHPPPCQQDSKETPLVDLLANTFSWTMRSGEITHRDFYRLSTRPKLIWNWWSCWRVILQRFYLDFIYCFISINRHSQETGNLQSQT